MDYDTIALTKLNEEMRLRQQCHASGPRPAHEAMTPADKDDLASERTTSPSC